MLTDEMQVAERLQRWPFDVALARGRTHSPATWRSYGRGAIRWLQTCQANGWQWDDIEEGHVRAYCNQMLYHPSAVTGRAYSMRTINGRLRRLAMFHTWAFRHALVDRLPFPYDTVRAPISADSARRLVFAICLSVDTLRSGERRMRMAGRLILILVVIALGFGVGCTGIPFPNCTPSCTYQNSSIAAKRAVILPPLQTLGSTLIGSYCYWDSWAMAAVVGEGHARVENLKPVAFPAGNVSSLASIAVTLPLSPPSGAQAPH